VIQTPMTQWRLDDAKARKTLDERVPMPIGRIGAPEDVAALLAWLAGVENRLVTGQVIFIDGGADAVLRGDAVW
jgi:NAD(P)-dependent dehydrogenase (short-subunit alcohol dehydrogenase family)